jgi:hypothetical protein
MIGYTLCDDTLYDQVHQYRWHKNQSEYTQSTNRCDMFIIHQLIIKLSQIDMSQGMVIDHIDHNHLNNCKKNLRCVTVSENTFNRVKSEKCTSRYIGVHADSVGGFVSYLRHSKKRLFLGRYVNETVATYVVDQAGLIFYPKTPPRNSVHKSHGWWFDKENI